MLSAGTPSAFQSSSPIGLTITRRSTASGNISGVASAEHAAARMTENDDALGAERRQQSVGIRRELLKAVLITLGLGRFAEADLIEHDDAIAVFREHGDRAFPRCRTKVFAV